MPNRAKAESLILKLMQEIEPTGYNVSQYKKILSTMSDKDFHAYMQGLQDGTQCLVAFKPLYEAKGITVENNFKVAKKYGLNFFERLVFTGDPSVPDHKTAIEFLVVDLPYRRQSQTVVKGVSVPEHNNTIDQLTYQATGDSKGAKISYPEMQVMMGMGLTKSLEELVQYRGGDRGGFNAYNAMFMRYGSANLKTLSQFSTGVESTRTVKTYLASINLTTTL